MLKNLDGNFPLGNIIRAWWAGLITYVGHANFVSSSQMRHAQLYFNKEILCDRLAFSAFHI